MLQRSSGQCDICLRADSPMQRRHRQHPHGPPGCDQDGTPAEQRPVRWLSRGGKASLIPSPHTYTGHASQASVRVQDGEGHGRAPRPPTQDGWVSRPHAGLRWQARQESQTCGKEKPLRSNTSTTGPWRRAGTMTVCTGLQVCLLSRTYTKLLTYHLCTFLQSRCTSPKRFI